jgi:hypothetical protein
MNKLNLTKSELPSLIGMRDRYLFNFSAYQFHQLLCTKGVPTVKIGKKEYIVRDKFLEWLDKNSIEEIVRNDN